MKQSRIANTILLLTLVFLYLPIAILVINSFNESRLGSHWAGFTLKWYYLLLEDEELWHALKNTLIVASCATVASTFIGSLAAFCLRLYPSKLQLLQAFLIYTPLVVPEVHMGISLMLLFVATHIPLGLSTIFIAHTTFCISYVTMIMLASLEEFDFSMVEAAMDLGASWKIIFKRILLPLLWPGLLASALLSFTLSLDDFVITFFVAGPGASTLPLYIYSMTKFGSPPLINALSTLLLMITLIAAWTTQRVTLGRSKEPMRG
jgi:spermidine/putrescine transport system permease protein